MLRAASFFFVVVLMAACASAGGWPGTPADGFAPIDGADLRIVGERAAADDVNAEELRSIAGADNAFALDLFRRIADQSDGNVILGPYSIWMALAMIHAGARGDTEAELASVLHFDRPQAETAELLNALEQALIARNERGAIDLRVANQVFAKPGLPLLDEYLGTLTQDFGAPLAELPFDDPDAARQVINRWAADRTDGRIEELFPPGMITPATALVLCNAISLDAAWTYLFDPAQTKVEPFNRVDGSVVEVPTMHFDLYLPLLAEGDLLAAELPYGTGELSMVLLLPTDLPGFIADVDTDALETIFDAIAEQGIHLSLPKFSFSSDVDLDETLQAMGIQRAYGADADFSGMTGEPGLFLETVQHEAFIEVDEAGTEAHAATGGSMALSHGPTITLDRPFLFVIRDRPTGAILFIGRVSDPSAE